jgi:ABC-2 type transport system permease protein
MIQALLYLQVISARNRFIARLRRLKQPKYLAGFLVGGLYFFFYFIRPVFLAGAGSSRGPSGWPGAWSATLELVGAVVLAAIILGAWIFPQSRAALTFTEAEATFLFPAPVRRQTLIHFKLLRSQAGILFSTLIMALLSNRFGRDGHTWVHFVGWWLLLSTLQLHFIGASFARTRLLDWGISHWTRRWILFGVFATIGLAAWWWLQTHLEKSSALASPKDFRDVWRHVETILAAEPIATLLIPFRWMVRPGLATTPDQFLYVVWPAVAGLVLHYFWVIRSDVAFEEASLELARQRTERMAAIQRDRRPAVSTKARRAPFVLQPTGSPVVALLWKNLIFAGTLFTLRTWIILTFSFGLPAMVIGLNARRGEFAIIIVMLLVMGLVWSVLLGPQLLRHDLRQDLQSAELLKLFPLPGWKIILGELLAPVLILSLVQWTLLAFIAILFHGLPGIPEIRLEQRLSVFVGAALICPAVNLISLLVPNAAVLLFPAWLQTGPGGPQGVEATGQRLIFLLGQLLVFALALTPAAILATAVHFALTFWLPWPLVVPIAAAAGVVLLLGEAAIGVVLLGKLFERLDVATALRP